MEWLLVLVFTGYGRGGIVTERMTSLDECNKIGLSIKKTVEDINNSNKLEFNCIEVKKSNKEE